MGHIDSEIADILGFSFRTFKRRKVDCPALVEALLIGKEAFDNRVELALCRSALGYETETVERRYDATGKLLMTIRKKFEVPASTTAQIFWLKNRRRLEWRQTESIGDLNPPPPEATVEHEPEGPPTIDYNIARRIAFLLEAGGKPH